MFLLINLALESQKTLSIPYTSSTIADEVCIAICIHLNIGPSARHIFALRTSSKNFLHPTATFRDSTTSLDFRVRFKVASLAKLKKLDSNAFEYYYHQTRLDVIDCNVPDIVYEKHRAELLGLAITDMFRVVMEKEVSVEAVEQDYRKFVPKVLLKKHRFFVKKPIRKNLVNLYKTVKDKPFSADFLKSQYLSEVDLIAPEYLSETFRALIDVNGRSCFIVVKVTPPHVPNSEVKYCWESKRNLQNWIHMCNIEELGFVTTRDDASIEITRLNGIPIYIKFHKLSEMWSFVSLLHGYYRLTCKWTFALCQSLITPAMKRLHSMRCHGPVGGEFSYAKLEIKANNQVGCYVIRESETSFNSYYIDVCVKDRLSSTPKTFKLTRFQNDQYIFNDDLEPYNSLNQLIDAYSQPEGAIYLKECIYPSEYDISPLLLCRKENVVVESLTESSLLPELNLKNPVCINFKDLQVYKDRKPTGPWCYTMNEDLIDDTCAVPLCSFSQCKITGAGMEYGGARDRGVSGRKCLKWDKKRVKVFFNGNYIIYPKFSSTHFPDGSVSKAKKYCRNPDADSGGPWCFMENQEGGYIEREYCDIPFCYDPECSVFVKNSKTYMHYTDFNGTVLTNIKFSIKLWNSDDFNEASARLVLSVLALPLTGQEINDLGVGIEVFISNKESALRFGNKDKPEFEPTPGILTSTNFTTFTLNWHRSFITLGLESSKKPIFLAEIKTKGNLMGVDKDRFSFYSIQGTNVLWNFPFCLDDDECDVHTTTGGEFQQFWPLRQKDIVFDLYFHLRGFYSASVLFTPAPTIEYPNLRVIFAGLNGLTRVIAREYLGGKEVVLLQLKLEDIIDYWEWREFSISFFANSLHIYMKKAIGMHSLLEASSEVFRVMRWFSVSSENSVAHWSFYCQPPDFAQPPPALLPECAMNSNEPDYTGTQDVTSSGLPCLPWSGRKMIPKNVLSTMFTNETLMLESKNYCRDPGKSGNGTFCFALDQYQKQVRKQFCQLRKCKSQLCKMAGTGNDFIGQLTVTRSGRECDFWDSSNFSVHQHFIYNNTYFPEVNSTRAKNFCRNPNRDLSGSWCFTKDPQVVQDVCGVRDCDKPEELTIIVATNKTGRRVFVLPQWREEGLHGGLRFSVKGWNPDSPSGIIFTIFPKEGSGEIALIIGAHFNEKVELYVDTKLMENKIFPHLISSGVWTDFWLQIRRGEILLGFRGVSTPFFKWTNPDMSKAFEPAFISYHSLFDLSPIGVFFHQKDECHTENTTNNDFQKYIPIGLSSDMEGAHHTNLTLMVRVVGKARVSLMSLINNPSSYQIEIDSVSGQRKDGLRNITHVYRGMWKVMREKKIEIALKFLKQDQEKHLKSYLSLTGQWTFVKSPFIVRFYGIALQSNDVSIVMEYFKLGPLDQYLRRNQSIIKTVDLIEATSHLASAVWHLKENNIVHGRIRCRKLMVHVHDDSCFTVKLTDNAVQTCYEASEVHWIAVECYTSEKRTAAADVWAMATTIYEMFAYGRELPTGDYAKMMNRYLNGDRLLRPAGCPEEIYTLLTECWQANPRTRKQSQEVSREVNHLLYQVYNSRKNHAYDVVGRTATNHNLSSSDHKLSDLVSADDLDDTSTARCANSLFGASSQQWVLNSDGCDESRDLSHLLSNLTVSALASSEDSLTSVQSICELDDSHAVVLKGCIGQGNFGQVFKGILESYGDNSFEPIMVAVKKVKGSTLSSVEDFEREINIMKGLKHPNIVHILGVLRDPDLQLVMEYVPDGCLQAHLKHKKDELQIPLLLKYATDIAQGMDYLGTKNIVHRDLAARNILVVERSHVKISDFGLAQFIGSDDYYTVRNRNRELPLKWYAPESFGYEGKFSVRSDVWSYGVTLYEMFAYGDSPPELGNFDSAPEGQEQASLQKSMLDAIYRGARYPCPEHCPQAVYFNVIKPCWELDPHARPAFKNLIVEVDKLKSHY